MEREQLTKLILWIQAAPSDGSGHGLPFDLPKLDTYRRCQQALHRLDEWMRQPAPGSRQRRHFETLRNLLQPVVYGDDFQQTVQDLERTQADFLRLREVLRVDPANSSGDRAADADFLAPVEAERCQEDAENFRQELRQRLRADTQATDVELRSARLLLRQLDKYWDGLFGHALVVDNGGLLLVTRTNNCSAWQSEEEATHRFGKRCQRRLHGRASLKRDLQRWPAERALLHNLTNPLYLERVYGTLDDLPRKFADAFALLPDVRAHSQSDPATVQLTPAQRKGARMLEDITRLRQLTAHPPT